MSGEIYRNHSIILLFQWLTKNDRAKNAMCGISILEIANNELSSEVVGL